MKIEQVGLLMALLFLWNCREENKMTELPDTRELPAARPEVKQALAMSKIYFGHQSVGYNIIEGAGGVQGGPLLSIREAEDFDGPGLVHSRVGKNKDPLSKINDFRLKMESGLGRRAEFAGFKFCYVDIIHSTDIDSVFTAYQDAFDTLEKRFPNATFFHLTVPLRVAPKGPSVLVKRLLGRPVEDDLDNIKRHRYNEKIRKVYGASGRLFDLAAVESAYPDGSLCFSELKEEGRIPVLIPDLTVDGGHLNTLGKERIGARFLTFLLSLTEKRVPRL